jgi:O-antigen/teichoic acid export membrane protein
LVFPYIYDDLYQNATVLYAVLAVGVLLAANSSLRVSYMVIEGHTKVLMYVAIFGTVVNIALNYIFIQSFGDIGAAIATVVTQLITSNLVYMAFKNYRKIPLLQVKSVFFFL